jgi:hypothetical protein
MLLIAGVAALVTAGALSGSDVQALEQLWPGIRDSSEEVSLGSDAAVSELGESSERRVRTVVARVSVPSLGPHVLYLEEFLHDDPESLRRQLLLQLEPTAPPSSGVRAHLFTFNNPGRWIHLDRRPQLLAVLRVSDVAATAAGCDLLLKREGDQFSGGTVGRGCVDASRGSARYVDYRLVIGPDLYWYRRRVLLKAGNDVQEEELGFNWFELDEARLFTCRVGWSSTGRDADLRLLARLDLHDQGGRGRFRTPDGRKLELALHSDDWPFTADRDALILLVQDEDEPAPLASAWTQIDATQIAVDLGWLQVDCGSIVPDADELWSAVSPPGPDPDADADPDSMSGAPDQRFNVPQQHRVETLGRFHHEEVSGVGEHFGFEVRKGLADAGLVGGRQVGVDRQHRDVDIRQYGGEIHAEQSLQ